MRNPGYWFVVTVLLAALTACTGQSNARDFQRHANSQFSTPIGGGDFYYFDVRFSAENPRDGEVAEARRIEWLEAWLKQRGSCPWGYTVVEQRPFGEFEHNPGRFDRRYKVQCNASETGT